MTWTLSILFLCALTGCASDRSQQPEVSSQTVTGEMPSNFVKLPPLQRARFYVTDLSTK